MSSEPNDSRETRITELEEELRERMEQIEELERDRTRLRERVEKLTEDLEKWERERPRFPVESLASSFRTLLEEMQAQAVKPTPSGTTGALREIGVELKGFVDVRDNKTQLVVPRAGEEVDAQALSVLKLSFVAVPTRTLPPQPPRQSSPAVPEPPPPKTPEQPPAKPTADTTQGVGRGENHNDG